MNITSFTSFFKKKPEQLIALDTILIKKLKTLSKHSNLLVFNDVKIYHHATVYAVGLIVLDSRRGLYIFESKEWTYDELKNANIQKAQNQEHSKDTLAYEITQSIIKQKFNELTHTDGVPIFNYLLMENLNADEYEHLNDSFKELLPKEKVIFSDSNEADILKKLHSATQEQENCPSVDEIMGILLTQYTILDRQGKMHLCSDEQRLFMDKPLESITHLTGHHRSGKSNLLLLKAIIELLDKKSDRVLILKPTVLACDIFKKKLLNIIEHAIVEVDLSNIEILTPIELLNKHLNKLGKESISHLSVPAKLLKKKFSIADVIMCDDSDELPHDFIEYLSHIQNKATLVLVSTDDSTRANLTQCFRPEDRKINFYKTNPHAKALHIISNLLAQDNKNIVVVSNSLTREKLKDDLASFVNKEPIFIDSSQALLNQQFNNLLFCSYTDIHELNAEHIILMDLCFTSEKQIEYAFNLAHTSVDVLFEEECQEIKNLRSKYEQSSKE